MKISLTGRTNVAIVMLFVIGWMGGCAAYQPPKFQDAGAVRSDTSSDGAVLEFDLEIANPNSEELPMARMDYTLEIGGEVVFKGTRSPQATIPANGTQRIRLPAVCSPAKLNEDGPTAYRLSGVLTYTTPGQLAETLFDAGARVPTVSFVLEGEVGANSK